MTGVDLSGPVIERDEHSAPFFDAARDDVLLLPRCAQCGRWHGPQAVTCADCGSDRLTWERAGGTATLVTWAVVHSAPHRAFADQLPYVTGYVELAEGPWIVARIVAADPARLRAGTGLRVAFVHPAEGESYPIVVPIRAAETSDPIGRST